MISDPAKKNKASQIRPFNKKKAKPSQPKRFNHIHLARCSCFMLMLLQVKMIQFLMLAKSFRHKL